MPEVATHKGVFGGTPHIRGTRIPVYMILDAIEFYGNVEDVKKSYPDLTTQQIKDALRFAKFVLEFRVDYEASHSD